MTNAQKAVNEGRITQDEADLLNHIAMWGSDGHPIRKAGRKWTWGPWRSIKGPPELVKTKREAEEGFGRYHVMLLDRLAGRI